MPKYRITLEDGRKLNIDADSQELAGQAASDWATKNPVPPPPPNPIARRFGEAVSAVGKDFKLPSSPQEALKGVVDTLTPVHQLKQAGDLLSLPLSVVGGGAEIGSEALRKATGFTPPNIPQPFIDAASIISPVLSTALQHVSNAHSDPSSLSADIGNIAEAIVPIPGVEAATGAADLAKATRLAREMGISLPTALSMLKQGITRNVTVREPGILSRIGHVVREAGRKLQQTQNPTHEVPEISEETRRTGTQVGQALVRRLTAKRDPTGKLLTENPVEARGKPVTGAEALGREAMSHLTMAGRRSGTTGDTLFGSLFERMSGMPDRVVSDFAQTTGLEPAEVEGDFLAANKAQRGKLKKLYDAAYDQGSLDSERLQQLAARPSVQAALKRARKMAAEEDLNPDEIGLIVGTKTQVIRNAKGELERTTMSEPWIEVRHPTVRTWDLVKRALDAELESPSYHNPTTRGYNTEGNQVNATRTALRDELFAQSPKYKKAVSQAGEPISQQSAFNKAPKLFAQNVSEYQFGREVAKMTPAEKRALLSGVLRDVWNKTQGSSVSLTRLLAPSFKAKLTSLIGKDKADHLFSSLEQERQLLRNAQRMTPGVGSHTPELLFADQEQKEAIQDVRRIVMPLLRRGERGWAQFLGELAATPAMGAYRGLRAPMEEAARDEVGRLLQLRPSVLHQALEQMKINPPTIQRVEQAVNRARARSGAAVAGAAVSQSEAAQ